MRIALRPITPIPAIPKRRFRALDRNFRLFWRCPFSLGLGLWGAFGGFRFLSFPFLSLGFANAHAKIRTLRVYSGPVTFLSLRAAASTLDGVGTYPIALVKTGPALAPS